MSTVPRAQIPAGARIEHHFKGSHDGGTVEISLYRGEASDGHKSGYTPRPARWLSCERFTPDGNCAASQSSRYGGSRFDRGLAAYDESITEALALGATEISRW